MMYFKQCIECPLIMTKEDRLQEIVVLNASIEHLDMTPDKIRVLFERDTCPRCDKVSLRTPCNVSHWWY